MFERSLESDRIVLPDDFVLAQCRRNLNAKIDHQEAIEKPLRGQIFLMSAYKGIQVALNIQFEALYTSKYIIQYVLIIHNKKGI